MTTQLASTVRTRLASLRNNAQEAHIVMEEFWRIRELIESTAYGARRKVRFDQLKEQ